MAIYIDPIFKKGDRSKPENYKAVSRTSVTCEVLEHIVLSSNMNHLESHNILSDAQHGFRKKRSCVSQLVLAVLDLAKGIDARDRLDMTLLGQRRYVRSFCNDHCRTSKVEAILNQLKWPTLQECRVQAQVVMIFCINNPLKDFPHTFLTPSTSLHRGHSKKIIVHFA
eukprot:XP_011661266.1 PREDICTED: uncharacterized protein LOC105436913 [Strongylocentrotus purpuratus]